MSHSYSERDTWNWANKRVAVERETYLHWKLIKISFKYQSRVSFELKMGN